MIIENSPKLGEETPKVGEENKDEKKPVESTNEDAKKGGDVEKKEDKTNEDKDPYNDLLEKLKEKDSELHRKGTALVEKNQKIAEMKKQLEEGGVNKDEIEGIVKDLVSSSLAEVEKAKKELSEQLSLAKETNIDAALSRVSTNDGEKKIIRHFFDTEVNKELPFAKQVQQATVLAKAAMSDEKFQAEIQKANSETILTVGRRREEVGLSSDRKAFGDALFKTKEGKKAFEENLKSKQ